jgi:hypothetical protein
MGQTEQLGEQLAPGQDAPTTADSAVHESLRQVMREVIATLPDDATLGELVDAARRDRRIAPVLDVFTVQELIETAKRRPRPGSQRQQQEAPQYDADGNPVMDLDGAPRVIRRRADVPDGDVRVLRRLAEHGPQRETELANATHLSSEQLRIILRQLRTKAYIHIEGSGTKRRYKITRHGGGHLRKQGD